MDGFSGQKRQTGAGLIAINKQGIVTKRIAKGFSEKGLIEALKDALYETGQKGYEKK
jgi:hypothetical protein